MFDPGFKKYLHYKDSGLDNLYLLNGFRYEYSVSGRYLFVENKKQLEKMVCTRILSSRKYPRGIEIRFLRIALDIPLKTLATSVGTTADSLESFEKTRHPIKNEALADTLMATIREHGPVRSDTEMKSTNHFIFQYDMETSLWTDLSEGSLDPFLDFHP